MSKSTEKRDALLWSNVTTEHPKNTAKRMFVYATICGERGINFG